MSRLSLSFLGGFEARLDGVPISGFESAKVRALLVYLAVEGKRSHRRETLAGLLWPGYPERSARASLRKALSSLRKTLGDQGPEAQFLAAEDETIRLNPDGEAWLDVGEFERALESGQGIGTHDRLAAPAAVSELERAASLYKGAFLEGFSLADSPEFEGWMRGVREALQMQVMMVLDELAGVYEIQGQAEKARQTARRALRLEPWHEESHRRLMRLLALDGQRSAALAQYAACQRSLKSELGVEPAEETRRLYEQIREGEPVLTGVPAQAALTAAAQEAELTTPHNLPRQLTSFIGREAETEAIRTLLKANALVTVVGAGGVGKTRVALQVAETLLDNFQHGVWLAELAPISDENLVLPTVARALGMHVESSPQAEEALLEHCRKRQLLLILDNCEHLVGACARLAETILSACPLVKVLGISREMLGIPGEAVFPLQPFSKPRPDDPLDQLSQYEAVRLFVERAVKIQPGFILTPENAPAAGRICAQLDGIPLAIELAAAWVRLLSVVQISDRLEESLDYLSGGGRTALPRQQTMRGCLDWSYNLLSEAEQGLLQALSVFTDRWSLEAAEALVADRYDSRRDVLELLDQLALKSLVRVRHDPEMETRYRLLEPVRQYAGEKLASEKLHDSGRMEAIRGRHLAFYQALAEEAAPHLRAQRQVEWLRRLERELPNIRQALDWACREASPVENLERGLRLGADLRFFWQSRCRYTEGAQWLERLLELEARWQGDQPRSQAMSLARAQALIVAVTMRWYSNTSIYNPAKFQRYLEEGLALFQQSGEAGRRGLAYARLVSVPMTSSIAPGEAIELLQAIYDEAAVLGDAFMMAECSFMLGNLFRANGNPNEAESYYRKSLDFSLKVGDLDFLPTLNALLGRAAFEQGDLYRAQRLIAEARKRTCEFESDLLHSTGYAYFILGEVAWLMGDYSQAEKDLATSIDIWKQHQFEFMWEEFYRYGIALSQGDYDWARSLLHDIQDAHAGNGAGWTEIWMLYLLGELDWATGDHAQAVQRFAELKQAMTAPDLQPEKTGLTSFPFLDMGKEGGQQVFEIFAAWGLAKTALTEGRWRAAAGQLVGALERQLAIPRFTGGLIEDDYAAVVLTAVLCARQGQQDRAARLLGTAGESYRLYGLSFPLHRRELIDQTLASTRAAMDEASFTAAWQEGEAMDLEGALAYALQVAKEIKEARSTTTR